MKISLKLKNWLFLGCLLLLGFVSASQVKMSIDTPGYNVPNVVHLGDMDSFFVKITNVGSDTFDNALTIMSSINNSTAVLDTFSGVEPSNGVGAASYDTIIEPGGSITEKVYLYFSPAVFSSGSSVVVIWPAAVSNTGQTVLATDSIKLNFTIDTTTAGINNPGSENLKVFCFGNTLHINYTPENGSAYVRIYDVNGSIMQADIINQPSTVISMSAFASGLYYVEVILPDQSHKGYKVFNLNK